jgi:hypothetical protein
MSVCVIDTVELQPYGNDRVIVVCGYNADEVIEWFKENNSNPESNDLKKIKKHFAWFNEIIEQIEDCREDLAGMDKDGESAGHGMYAWEELKTYPRSMFRMIILKYGFDPTDPSNMTTLCHEVLHLCQEFLPKFLNRDVEKEAEAYFHSHIVEKIYTLFL